MKEQKKQKEPYLKIPAHILNLAQTGLCGKVLLAHIYSFGTKGCWQSNKTLAELFMVSADTISRWIAKIKPFIYLKNSKGYYRTLWAKSHPDVIESGKDAEGPRQNGSFDLAKSAIRLRQNCRTTNNHTITEDYKRTMASPSPLPACGQAPATCPPSAATLQYRRQAAAAEIEKFKKYFGRADRLKPLTPQQFEQRKAQQLAALKKRTPNAIKCVWQPRGISK